MQRLLPQNLIGDPVPFTFPLCPTSGVTMDHKIICITIGIHQIDFVVHQIDVLYRRETIKSIVNHNRGIHHDHLHIVILLLEAKLHITNRIAADF